MLYYGTNSPTLVTGAINFPFSQIWLRNVSVGVPDTVHGHTFNTEPTDGEKTCIEPSAKQLRRETCNALAR